MANLAKFKRDSRALDAGEWVAIGGDFDDIEIQTRGFNDEYTDARAAALRKMALKYRGDSDKITTAEIRAINTAAMAAHCLRGVRNLSDDNGPVSLAAFLALLPDPDYTDLYYAVLTACAMAGRARAADAADDAGNSKPA